MTWQEELRRLDEELAAGSLTADEYRTRRDRVLSMAVTAGDSQPQQAPGQPSTAAETQIITPVSPPSRQQPAPDQPAGSADATQVVSSADAGGERTQVVQPWQQHPNSPSGGFPQPMGQPQYSQPSPPSGFARPQQQPDPWGAAPQDVSPPWGGSEFPPLGPSNNSNAGWISQGPETFQTQPSSGKGKKIAFIALGVVVVVGLAFGVWALFIKNNGDTPVAQQSTSQQPPPVPTTKPLPEPPAAKAEPEDNSSALVTPAGKTRAGGGSFDIAKLESAKFLPPTVTERLKQGGMTDGLLKTTTDGDVTLGLYALEMPDKQSTTPVAQEYANAQQEGGLTASRDLSLHGVPVFAAPDGGGQTVYRAVYVLYSRVIIVDAYGTDKDATLSSFKTLLAAQVQKAPPTERTNN
ncbi:DUF1707 domain-containing protein [Amycolatopsis sp. NBC_01488]|uniref:DUF1707 domain-containing protein n=1 Tax=Amycolatopsis sp. NBC_01488 TaxID=2903563 RepID=UPI002E2BCC80|nr:DUF1707 domain-containing protein [Amycolatopsis sp. NBC_01488]